MFFPFETFDEKIGDFPGDRHGEDRGDDAEQDENGNVPLEGTVDGENPDARREKKEGEPLEKEVRHFRDLVDLDDFRTKQEQKNQHGCDVARKRKSANPVKKVPDKAHGENQRQLK